MLKKNLIILILLLFILIPNVARSLSLRGIITSAAYYPSYPKYQFNSPVIGFNAKVDILNIYEYWGIGGSAFLKIVSYHNYFQNLQYYRLYIHRFWNIKTKDSYFLHGFFTGIKQTNLEYEDYKTHLNAEVFMTRPLFGYHFSTEIFGASLSWTQTENHRSKWEWEIKSRNSYGLILQIGGSLKGPISGMKSDLHICTGYEFNF